MNSKTDLKDHIVTTIDTLPKSRSTIIWGTQCTVDYKVHFTAGELRDLLIRYNAENILDNCKSDFDNIINGGLIKDTEPQQKLSAKEVERALQSIDPAKIVSELGGSPAISALKEYHLQLNSKSFPRVYFSGLRPASVKDFLSARIGLEELFHYTIDSNARPQTLGLEVGDYKLMLSCKDGRSPSELADKTKEEKEFQQRLGSLKSKLKTKTLPPQEIAADLGQLVNDYQNSSEAEIKDVVSKLQPQKSSYGKAIVDDYQYLRDLVNNSGNNEELDRSLRNWYRGKGANLDLESKSLEKMLDSYCPPVKFDTYIQRLRDIIDEQVISSSDDGSAVNGISDVPAVVIALGGLNKGSTQECQKLVDNIKELKKEYQKKGAAVKLFVGTNVFKEDPKEIKAYWNAIKWTDIISVNESELNSIYNALYPGDAAISLGEKFRRVGSDFKGVMICHSAEGAILGAFGNADNILGKSAEELPSFLEKSLRLAVDGTTSTLQNGSTPAAAEINFYSENVRSRQEGNFRNRYVHPQENLANGIVGVYSPNVSYPAGNLVGLGACFDGLLLSYLFRRD